MCLSSAMDFCFGLVAIFLILDVASVQSTDNSCSKKEMYSNKVRLSEQSSSINPFLQVSINRPNTQDNSFNPLNCNENKNPISIAAQAFNIAFSNNNNNPFSKNKKNPFLNYIRTNSRVEFPNSPVTQTSYTSLPYYQTSEPITSVPNIPVFNTPAENDLTYIPPKIHPPIPRSLLEEPVEISPVKTISERKCEEYAKEIAGTTLVTFLTGSSSDVREVINNYESENRLVINGTEAQVGEFPHMVALGTCNDMQNCSFNLKCGGALISHTWALSSAHCSHGPNGGPTVAKIGSHNLIEQKGVIIAIEDMIRHPDYRPPLMYADIALVKLEKPVTFDKFIRPACLYQQYDIETKEAWISGWGGNETHGKYSNSLLKAKLDLIDNQNCREKYKNSITVPHGITSNMICTSDLQGNWTRDTCQGDSGGPLQIAHLKSECLFQVIGITSIGMSCAMSDIPSVYTRVSSYISWIEDHVWQEQ